ncbi:hypothetical protein DOY81_007522 [Sarcophaga bullata]|nr:hypothetical protein DOY81_007522 [Sarcophaga bullata]
MLAIIVAAACIYECSINALMCCLKALRNYANADAAINHVL